MSRPFRFSGRHFAAGLLATTALAGPAYAQNDLFTGAHSHDWYDGANWSAGQPPAAADSAGINGAAASIDHGQIAISNAKIGENSDGSLSLSGGAQVDIGKFLWVGVGNATGSLDITSGAMLTSSSSQIGTSQFDGVGHVTLTGAGSFWSAGDFNLDNGTLQVADHAELVTGGAGTLDRVDGANSLISLTGGASWISHSNLSVIGDDYLDDNSEHAPSRATIAVDSGATLSLENAVFGLHGGTGILTSTGGSTTIAGDLTVGGSVPYENFGNGQIDLSQGATLTSGSGDSAAVVGSAGGTGKAMLTGAGTSWTQNGTLGIGIYGGNGDVELGDQAVLSSDALTIGDGDGGEALFSLDDADATTGSATIGTNGGTGEARLTNHANWQVNGSLNVGGGVTGNADGNFEPLPAGIGSVSIKGGSTLSVGSMTAIGAGAGAQGSVGLVGSDDAGNASTMTVNGVTFIGAFGGTGQVSTDDGAAFNSNQLIVGYDAATGSLSSDGGAIAITRDATIGSYSYQDGPTSGALVLSNRASFTAGDYVYVGEQGNGTVAANGNSTLETGAATFGLYGGTADVSLTDQSQWLVHGALQIGGGLQLSNGAYYLSAGTANVAIDGSQLYSDSPPNDTFNLIGAGSGSSGTVTVTGQNALLHTEAPIFIGAVGATGTVKAQDDASIEFMKGATIGLGSSDYPGAGSQSSGSVSLDHSIGSANITYVAIDQGSGGSTLGNLSLSDGSRWTGEAMLIGTGAGAIGNVTLDASSLNLTDGLAVGLEKGTGVLLASNSQIDLGAGDLEIGGGAGTDEAGTGIVGIEGGSSLITQGNLVVGGTGMDGTSGQLNVIDNGSTVSVGGITGVLSGGAINLTLGATADFGSGQSLTIIGSGGNLNADAGAQLNVHGMLGIYGTAHITASGAVVDEALIAAGGALDIDAGSEVGADYISVYGADGATGVITLSGQGSRLNSTGAIDLGSFDYQGNAGGSGVGQLILGTGTELNADHLNIGTGAGAGILTVHANPLQNLNFVKARVGEFNLGAEGIYQVGIDTASASAGVVRVAGDATLGDGGTINVFKEAGGQYQLGDRYAILLTDLGRVKLGDVSLTGDTRRSLFVGLVPEITASPVSDFGEALYLDVKQDKSFASVAGTPNQVAAASGADSLPDDKALKAAMLDIQTEDEARHSYDLISGEIHASVRSGLYDDARLPREAVLERLSDGQGGNGASLWMQSLGDWGTIGSDRNAAALGRSAWGMLGGLDADLGGATIGVAGGYTDTTLRADARASRASVKSWHVLGYAGASLGAVRLRGGVGYAYADIDTRRSVAFTGYDATLNAGYHGSTLQGFGEIGYALPVRGATIEPFAGISAVRSHTDAFHESGGAAALSVAAAHDTVTASTLGLHMATTSPGPLFAAATLGWQHRFGDRTPVSTMRFDGGDAFDIAGAPVSSDAAAASLTAGWRITPATTLTARYSGQIGGGSDASAIKLTLGIHF